MPRDPSPLAEALHRERRAVRRAIGAGSVVALSTVGLAATSAWLIVRAAERPGVLTLTVPIGLVQIFALTKAAGRYAERVSTHRAALRAMTWIRVRVAGLVEPLVPAGLGVAPAAAVDLVVNDVDRVQDLLTTVAAPLAAAGVAGLASLVVVGLMDPLSAAVLAGGLLVAGALAPWLAARVGESSEAGLLDARTELRRLADLAARSGAEIRGCGARTELLGDLATAEARLDGLRRQRARAQGLVALVAAAGSGAALVGVVLATASAVRDGSTSRTLVAVPALAALAVLELASSLAPSVTSLRGDLAAADRLAALTERPRPVVEPATESLDVTGACRIVARGLYAGYDGVDVLHGVDVELAPGSFVGVSGPSGGGKTTLAWVLARLLDASSGRVELGGADYTALTGDQVRGRVGYVDDDPHVFLTTLAGNLRVAAPEASDDDLIAALEAAGLGPLLTTLPEGLATPLGGPDGGLSGGERRRLGVARELLTGRPVALFDEPSEGLDDETADRLLDSLARHYAEGAVLVVSHRERDLARASVRYRVPEG